MSKNEWKTLVGSVGRILLAYALLFSQSLWAGQNQQAKDKTGSPEKAASQQAVEKQSPSATTPKTQPQQGQAETTQTAVAEEHRSGRGTHEGIKVHGHWTIEVRNPDGTRVSRVEFENALTTGGATSLTGLLLGSEVQGGFIIFLSTNTPTTTGPCSPGSGGSTVCVLFASLINPTPATFADATNGCPGGANCFPLTIAPNAAVTGISLTGSAMAGSNGQITDVSVGNLTCGPYPTTATSPINVTSPSTCAAGTVANAYGLTHATLSSPVQVLAGQTIAVTVNISFS